MEQIDFLEQELNMMLENIKRIREFKKQEEGSKYIPSSSNVVGELKHRAIGLKQRLTLVSSISTRDLLR